MHERKCDLCSAKVYAFNDVTAAEMLEEHMDLKHPERTPPKHGQDLRLTLDDANFLHSVGVAPWR